MPRERFADLEARFVTVTVEPDRIRVGTDPARVDRFGRFVLVAGLLFVGVAAAAAWQGLVAAAVVPGVLGLLMVVSALVPPTVTEVLVTSSGVRVGRARGRRATSPPEAILDVPASTLHEVRVERVLRSDPQLGPPHRVPEWRVTLRAQGHGQGQGHSDGDGDGDDDDDAVGPIGLVVEDDAGRAWAVAEHAAALLGRDRQPLPVTGDAPGTGPSDAPPRPPENWPQHPRIEVERAGHETRLRTHGRRLGRTFALGTAAIAMAGAGVAATGGLVWAAATEDVGTGAATVLLVLTAAPLALVLGGFAVARLAVEAARAGGGWVRVTSDGLHVGDETIRHDAVRTVVADGADVHVVTDEGVRALGFHGLTRTADRAWARDAVAHLVDEARRA